MAEKEKRVLRVSPRRKLSSTKATVELDKQYKCCSDGRSYLCQETTYGKNELQKLKDLWILIMAKQHFFKPLLPGFHCHLPSS
ncbi:hypothetical protein AT2G12170 [Arabidopsis thaliana]|uniref:Uncharacterized protein n=1 Tax=Arabidopsis thaliana TaxID=3702 RepID=F4ISD8_ARATH|nr:uncharacterized protein AT2G12170 [Arabidopsis thaliana]AEC06191.2 hypothetical protein AT2G12170 [Arabidopsis thaliana]|eukprot:NP_001318213.1 hypothetical protein AT2G12170 [Arabidopsis thaliana]